MNKEDYDDEIFWPEEEPGCEMFDVISSMIFMPKPFGLTWSDEKIAWFLKKRGYKIFEKKKGEISFKVAVKPTEPLVPDEPNINKTFNEELQDILLNWVLSLDKNE